MLHAINIRSGNKDLLQISVLFRLSLKGEMGNVGEFLRRGMSGNL